MPKEKREISKEDIMPLDVYTKNRKELRKNIVDFNSEFFSYLTNSIDLKIYI